MLYRRFKISCNIEGKHETGEVNAKTGAVWKKVKSWFGYGLHLIADTDHEVPVAFEVTRASASEPGALSGMVEELFARRRRWPGAAPPSAPTAVLTTPA